MTFQTRSKMHSKTHSKLAKNSMASLLVFPNFCSQLCAHPIQSASRHVGRKETQRLCFREGEINPPTPSLQPSLEKVVEPRERWGGL